MNQSSQEITTLNDNKCVVEMDLSEDLENSSFNPQDSRFDQIVGAIEEILMEEEFQSVMREFCDKYCQEFDENCEVNKLEYTSWFNEYTELVETNLQKKLRMRIPLFNMEEFLVMLKEREEEIIGDVWDVLLSMGDFSEFRAMMIAHKLQVNGQAIDASQFLQVNVLSEQYEGTKPT